MSKITTVLEIDDERIKMASEQDDLEDAISSELSGLSYSGIYVESWQFKDKDKDNSKAQGKNITESNISHIRHDRQELSAEDILSNAIDEMERSIEYIQSVSQHKPENIGISPEHELIEDMRASVERLYDLYFENMKQLKSKLPTVSTPIGDIVITSKIDPAYPGIYIDLQGEKINDTFELNKTSLATVEYDIENKKIKTIVYGDSNREEPSIIVEHGNYLKKPLSTLIDSIKRENDNNVNTKSEDSDRVR